MSRALNRIPELSIPLYAFNINAFPSFHFLLQMLTAFPPQYKLNKAILQQQHISQRLEDFPACDPYTHLMFPIPPIILVINDYCSYSAIIY